MSERLALVTGAASGMGRATCIRLTSEACRVFALDINSSGLEETASLVKDAGGSIEASNRRNGGACFRVDLPIRS